MPYHLDTYEKGFQVFELLKPFDMAVGVGFEPTEGINPQRFSRPPLSTTQPAHQIFGLNVQRSAHYSDRGVGIKLMWRLLALKMRITRFKCDFRTGEAKHSCMSTRRRAGVCAFFRLICDLLHSAKTIVECRNGFAGYHARFYRNSRLGI